MTELYAIYDGAEGGGFVREMDARAKLLFGASCMLVVLASGSFIVPLATGGFCLTTLLFSGVSPKSIAVRQAGPLTFALFVGALQALLTPGTPAASFGIAGVAVSLSAEGAARGSQVIGRVFGASGIVLFLTMTTPAHRLLSAAARLRMPKAFVEVALLTYRYVFVLLEDAVTVYHAQRGRLGYARWGLGMRSLGTLAGSVLLRAYGQAEATGESMRMRGYTGEYVPVHDESLRPLDAAFLGGAFAVCLTVFIWTS